MFIYKFPSIFLPQMEAIVFIILQIVFAVRAILKIGVYLTIVHRSGGEYTLFQNGRHLSILLFSFKLALVASFLNSKFKRIFSFKRGNKG